MRTWQLQEARSRFKDLFDDALGQGPQRITRHGKQAVVVVSEAEWEKLMRRRPSFGALLAECPLDAGDLPPRRKARALRARLFEA
ncbi:MAG TPA: type II toxin-antitoxin system Phd/YefM family antitoxin [Stellaceae bacterium]|nr:type II toxin-antitoxin system Phd/YefM family antitoxin [Stellaceae bacterium]